MKRGAIYALLAAALFGASAPISKFLLGHIHPVVLAGYLYVGAFIGLGIYSLASSAYSNEKNEEPLGRSDIPWLAGAIIAGGIVAPILLMVGLTMVSGISASLLLNLEAVMTASIAVIAFREHAGKRLWVALLCMTVGGVLLSWDASEGRFSILGPVLIVLAMVCWGIDNNLTRAISGRDPISISRFKGACAGVVSLCIAVMVGARLPLDIYALLALTTGAFAYGASILLFVKALAELGASRTGALFGMAPFVGAMMSLAFLRESAGWLLVPAAVLMACGAWLLLSERHQHAHVHEAVAHAHSHTHADDHHAHEHADDRAGPHSHEHMHESEEHAHAHWPDTHHRHSHDKDRD
jgi:drug/metabolite transporter (DMT)-like permease